MRPLVATLAIGDETARERLARALAAAGVEISRLEASDLYIVDADRVGERYVDGGQGRCIAVAATPDPSIAERCIASGADDVLTTVGSDRELEMRVAAIVARARRHIEEAVETNRRRRKDERSREAERRESLGLLAGTLAHDFNNCLSSVLTSATAALAQTTESSPLHEPLMHIVAAAERATELTQKMLAYAGADPHELVPIELAGMLGATERDLGRRLPRGIELTVDRSTRVWVLADRAHLDKILALLVENAIESLGGVRGRIAIRVTRDEHGAEGPDAMFVARDAPPGAYGVIEVHDDGEGMPADILRHAFDPFFTTRAEKKGIGLAVVLGLVLGHRGAIDVETDVGRGTTVRVLLPEGRAHMPAVVAATGPAGKQVMIVDDDPIVRRGIARTLVRAGYEILECEDGLAAVEHIERGGPPPAAVVLDLTMPRLDGMSTFDRMRLVHPALPVVVVTGFATPDVVERLEREVNAYYIPKPFQPATLIATLKRMIAVNGGG